MLTILLHSSKTMRPPGPHDEPYQPPALLDQAGNLAEYLKSLSRPQLQKHMQLSAAKAEQTLELIAEWTVKPDVQRPALDAFLGDIYSGLQVQTFSKTDRGYANEHLIILSGLYGGLRALDSIYPYRLEMGYKLPMTGYKNLYEYWGESIAKLIPETNDIINLSAVEYSKAVLPYLKNISVVTPKFLTMNSKSGAPTFVTVHAKIARGAFAHWLITSRIDSLSEIIKFKALGYEYDEERSTPQSPVFVCNKFKGLGLSVRLT